ncbi:MAG: DUF1934 domain-containing protein [Provencibacterium sp.]|jgi:uncharacterized beta-barrel protein YwiB (DUF1934 family)|nr:DUF1934 domain-containing protein [Provencibacterium sp.]
MKKQVFISIRGIQRVEGQEETVELMTVGNLYRKKNDYYLTYEETEATGFDGSKTTLRLEEETRVTMQRSGPYRSQLIVEKGRRHQCCYETGYGEMLIGVSGGDISSTLTDEGGNLHFKYSLDVNTSLASENEVYINVRCDS